MRIVLIVNARSGRGHAGHVAAGIMRAMRERGYKPELATLDDEDERRSHLEEADVAVIVGGDGTLHAVLEDCVATGTPVYHAPAGTENLFAREFGMTPRPASVIASLESGERRSIDVGRAGETPFAIMASIGLDASVIHTLSETRGPSITHLSYIRPSLRCLRRFRLPVLTIRIDGDVVAEKVAGLVVVANLRQYAMRLDPARDAKPDDGLLDVAFFPFTSRLGLAGWLLLTLLGRHVKSPRFVNGRGRRIEIEAEGEGVDMQIDGEAATPNPGDDGRFRRAFTIQEAALEVLLPVRKA